MINLSKIKRLFVGMGITIFIFGFLIVGAKPTQAESSTNIFDRLAVQLSELRLLLQKNGSNFSFTKLGTTQSLTTATVTRLPGYVPFTSELYTLSTTTQLAIPKLADIDVLKRSDTEFYITGTNLSAANYIKIYSTSDLNTFKLATVFKPSLASTTADFCSIWAPDLSYINNKYVLTFSAQIRTEGQPCEAPSNSDVTEPTLYQVSGVDIYNFGSPVPLRYGPVHSGVGNNQSTMKIDPDIFEDRLYYVWFGNGNNISSVSTVSPFTTILHTIGGSWNEGLVNEAPQLFRRNGILYMQFSVNSFQYNYGTKYLMGSVPTDLVRTASNAYSLATAIVLPNCDVLNVACTLESYGHGAVFERAGQYYYFHHRLNPAASTGRNAFLTPLYFKPNGEIASITTTELSWNALGAGYQYSLDVLPKGSTTWVAPCAGPDIINGQTSFNYNGLCQDANNTIVRKQDVSQFRLCFTADGQWGDGHATCKVIDNDVTQDTLQFNLARLTNTKLTWNQLGSPYKYALGVLPKGSTTWVAPCVGAGIINNQTKYNYSGLCPDAHNQVIQKTNVGKFRLCYTSDGRWSAGHFKCQVIANDITKNTLSFNLTARTDTVLTWNQLGSAYQYSLDVLPKDSTTWVAPCAGVTLIYNQTSFDYGGLCPDYNQVIQRTNVDKFRLCYTRDGQWSAGHVKCRVISNDITKYTLPFALTAI